MSEVKEKYTDEVSVKMKLEKQIRMLIYVGAGLIIGTNFINVIVNRVYWLEVNAEYDRDANKRRLEHLTEKQDLKTDIILLKRDLKNCERDLK